MEHRSMRGRTAAEMMPLHQARKSPALTGADDIHHVFGLEFFRQHAIALLQVALAGSPAEMKFTQELDTLSARLRQVLRQRFILLPEIFHQSELHGIVAVRCRRFPLCHDARASLEQRYRNYLSLRREHLCHANLLAENSWTHAFLT